MILCSPPSAPSRVNSKCPTVSSGQSKTNCHTLSLLSHENSEWTFVNRHLKHLGNQPSVKCESDVEDTSHRRRIIQSVAKLMYVTSKRTSRRRTQRSTRPHLQRPPTALSGAPARARCAEAGSEYMCTLARGRGTQRMRPDSSGIL